MTPKNLISVWFLSLLISNLSLSVELMVSNTVDTWYGVWRELFIMDTMGISENDLSIRLFDSRIKGEFDILYTTYWERGFTLKDTTATHIFWKQLEVTTPQISFIIGNFYSRFGQGLILGMEPDVALRRERLIEGIKCGIKLANFELCQIWGTPYEIDRLQLKYEIRNDTSDILFGGEASYRLDIEGYNFLLSGCGLHLNVDDTLYTNLCGGGFEFKSNWFLWYIELTKKFGWDRIEYIKNDGLGMYSSIDIIPYGIKLQVMNYDTLSIGGVDYQYNLLPVLNQSGYQIDAGVRSRDGLGFQIIGERGIGDVIFSVSHSQVTNKDRVKPKGIVEYYLKAEYMDFYGSLKSLSLTGGVNPRFNEHKALSFELHGSFKNIEGVISMSKTYATTWLVDSVIPFTDIRLVIQFPIYEIFTMHLDYTRRSKEVIQEAPGIEWYGIGMRIESSSNVFFELWGGKEKGGFVCSGGICRWVTPFEGVKVKLNIRL